MFFFEKKNQKTFTIAAIGLVLVVMVGLVVFSVPLYRLFCAATGAGGTTQRVSADNAGISAHTVTVSFDTNVAPGLAWSFQPVQQSQTIHLGTETTALFDATNLSDQPIVGHATFNVTPDKAGIYFKKIQCFCFTEERLAPHQTVRMPVVYFVDPRLGTDPSTTDVTDITLSYTFFVSKNPARAADLARLAVTGPPSAARGQQLFATSCSACHALDRNKVGPALAGVVGRKSAAMPGYPYSSALTASGIVWTPAALEKWLSNPQADVPGALMPLSVGSASQRRDIVAYLGTQKSS